MGNTSEIRNGLTIRYSHDIYAIVEFLHVKPGKGPAFIRTKLKSIASGKVIDHTFPSGAKLDIVRVERQPYQYLYRDDDTYYFMNKETFEQLPINEKQIPSKGYINDGMECELLINMEDDSILEVRLPQTVVVKITYTEPGIKGDTATNSLKPATIETGANIKVPLFINVDDKVKINTETGAYMERVKE